jgi:hypothetical protein
MAAHPLRHASTVLRADQTIDSIHAMRTHQEPARYLQRDQSGIVYGGAFTCTLDHFAIATLTEY